MKKIEDLIPKDIKDEIKRLQKTGVPRCIVCKKDFIQLDEYSWKPDCKCNGTKDLVLSMG